MHTVTYHMTCGCTLDSSGLMIHRHRGNKTCREHYGSKVDHRSKVCTICNQRFDFSAKATIPASCKACRKKLYNARAKRKVGVKGTVVDPDTIMHYECGCTERRADAKKISLNGSLRFACKVHRSPVAYREGKCEICGKPFQAPPHSHMSVACPECRRAMGKAVAAKRPVESAYYVTSQASRACEDRADCKHKSECLDTHWHLKTKRLPCLGCTRYEPEQLDMSAYGGQRYDETIWALGL